MPVARHDVTFSSEGTVCSASLYVPNGTRPTPPRPAIVMAHGIHPAHQRRLPAFADVFASAGFVVTLFDYRCAGECERGLRHPMLAYEQHEDYRNALAWTHAQSEVDPDRIGVWGMSYSGGHALHVSARDPRVKAVVAQMPVLSHAIHVNAVSATPLRMIVAESDPHAATDMALATFERAPEPKSLVQLKGGHSDGCQGTQFDAASAAALDWFRKHLTASS